MANNAEKSLHPAAYLNFRKEEVFSRWVAVWFDFHSQLLSRFSPQLLLWYFYTSSYTPFSKSMCFFKNMTQLLLIWSSKQNCNFFLIRFSLFTVMDAKMEKARRRGKKPCFSSALYVLLSHCWIYCFDSSMLRQTLKHAIWEF